MSKIPKYIKVPVYWATFDNGDIMFNTDAMLEDYEAKLSWLIAEHNGEVER